MTKQELIKLLKKEQKGKDTEVQHSNADDFLIAFINDKDITKEYNKVPKWYA